MDNKITRPRLKQLLSYDLIKIIFIIVAGVLVWSLLFTIFGDSLDESQKFGVYSYNVTVYAEELNTVLEKEGEDSFRSYDMRETSYNDFGQYSATDTNVPQQFSAYLAVGQMDVFFCSSVKDLGKDEDEGGKTALIDRYMPYIDKDGREQGSYFYDLQKMTDDAIDYCIDLGFTEAGAPTDKSRIEQHFLKRKKGDNFLLHKLITVDDEYERLQKVWKYAHMMQELLSNPEIDIWYRCELENSKSYGKIYGVDMGKLDKLGKSNVTGKSAVNLCCYNYGEEGVVKGAEGVVLSVFNNEYARTTLTNKKKDKNYLFYESLSFIVEIVDSYSCAFEA